MADTNDLTMNIAPCPDEELELAYEHFKDCFENFVFEGGGIRGIAFGGAIYYMEKHNLIKQIKRFAGSSAGSIVAAALSVGYTGKEIIKILRDTDFKKFEDDSWGVVGDLYRIMTKFGVYKGEAFEEWFETVLGDKTGNPNITFLEVYKIYGNELAITGTCLNTCETHYYHWTTYPNMPVKKAVRISMSIPVFFASVKENNTVMVDGGLLNNYPIWVFDGNTIGDSNVTDDQITKSKTIGFKLMTDQEKQDYKLYHVDEEIDNIFQYAKALINSLLIQIERGHIRTGYWKKTVPINTHNVSSLEFSLPGETIQKLIQTGYDSIHEKFVDIQREQLKLQQVDANVTE
jgi:NTE family protein